MGLIASRRAMAVMVVVLAAAVALAAYYYLGQRGSRFSTLCNSSSVTLPGGGEPVAVVRPGVLYLDGSTVYLYRMRGS